MSALTVFLEKFAAAFEAGHLLKCTLGKPAPAAPADLKNIYLRPVQLKKGPHVAFNFRYKTRDEVKNFPLQEALDKLENFLGREFLHANLLTFESDFSLQFDKNQVPHLSAAKPSHSTPPDLAHDRSKQRLLDPAAPWLHALGITNAKGEVLQASQDKWRQINKYLEIINSLLRSHPLPPEARIADMGSGKGYLTFALYDFLKNHLGMRPQITGIELRPNLVDFCNREAQKADFQDLTFVAQDIKDFRTERLDMLIALHACDTATDLALAAGIHRNAGIIVAAPCCHKQIRRDMAAQNELAPVLRHGILEERQAEILTDGIRALLLESEGYRTQVFEFISTEHTAKNVMVTAVKERRKTASAKAMAVKQIDALKAGFGIKEHYLERLLKADSAGV